jgi:hypothetical protein
MILSIRLSGILGCIGLGFNNTPWFLLFHYFTVILIPISLMASNIMN